MSALFTPLLVLHVVVAVLGLGAPVSIAIASATARQAGSGSGAPSAWLARLLGVSAFSLGAMLVTGALMDLAMGGAFHDAWWFRISALLLVATGILNGLTRRMVRGLGNGDHSDAVFRRIARMAYAMCGLVAVIAGLMEVRPF